MRKFLLAGIAVAMMATPAFAQTYKFVIVPKAMNNPFFDFARDGCQKRAKELGNIECIYKGPVEHEPATQAQIIQDFITQKVDGLAISVADVAAMTKSIEAATAAGVKKIVASCPHCVKTIGHDYRFFGYQVDIVHSATLIEELTRTVAMAPASGTVTFHDVADWARTELSAPNVDSTVNAGAACPKGWDALTPLRAAATGPLPIVQIRKQRAEDKVLRPLRKPNRITYFLPRIASLAALATRNFTTRLAAILIVSPVAGLRPMRALRFTRTNLPSPGIVNVFLAFLQAKATSASKQATACFLVRPTPSARAAAICDLVNAFAIVKKGYPENRAGARVKMRKYMSNLSATPRR